MDQPEIHAAYVTDMELANLWCGNDSRNGLFIAPCGTLTLLPNIRTLRRTPGYDPSPDVLAVCDQMTMSFSKGNQNTPPFLAPSSNDKPTPPKKSPRVTSSPVRAMILQILKTTTPCTVPGCDDWRVALDASLSTLASDCPACERNSAYNKIVAMVQPDMEAFLQQNPDYQLPVGP